MPESMLIRNASYFSRVQAANFRSLRNIDQAVAPFQALVGPNASGKSTFLDVIELLGDLMRLRGDVVRTISARSSDFSKLLWLGHGSSLLLALEAPIPSSVLDKTSEKTRALSIARYQIELAFDPVTNELGLDHETLWMVSPEHSVPVSKNYDLFPNTAKVESQTFFLKQGSGRKMIVSKKMDGNDNYYSHGTKSYNPSFRTGRLRAALANAPADEDSFPVSTWFRDLLERGVQNIQLNSNALQQPSPPGLGQRFQVDGSNLPFVVEKLRSNTSRYDDWVEHVGTALDDVRAISTIERENDKHRYIVVEYNNGAQVPSWLLSDGSLRLMALTILAYLDDLDGVYLIEEPENGIHPRAIETVMQSLGSIYGSQVLTATHSPVALNMLKAEQILCFAKDEVGGTDIVAGHLHPQLRSWKTGQPDLGTLFASGILS